MRRPSWPQLAFGLGLALTLAVAGQLALRQQARLAGLAAYAAAALLFIFTLRALEANPAPPPADLTRLRHRVPTFLLWLASGLLLAFVIFRVNHPEFTAQQDRLTLLAWLMSVACFIVGTLQVVGRRRAPARTSIRIWAAAHTREILSLGALLTLALALRLYQVDVHPYPFSGDEGSIGTTGRLILSGHLTNFFETAWSSQPVWSFVPTAITEGLLGDTIFAVRLVGVITGTLTIVALYLLARETFGRGVALLAASFLVAFPYHLQFSRLGVNNVMDALLASGVLWLTFRALRRGGLEDYLWAGLAAGGTLYTYLGSRLVLALAVGTLGYVAVSQRGYLRAHVRHLALFALAAVVVAAPMAAFFIRHPDIFMARINQEGILQNGWLAREVARTLKPVPVILWDQLQRSVMVFITGTAPRGFFNSPLPYLTSLAAVFFVLGLAYAVWRAREPRYLTLLAWFWAVVILGSALTVNPPTSERLVMSIPAAALLVALGLRRTAAGLQRLGLVSAPIGALLCAGVMAVVNLQGVLFYFGDYRSGHYFADASGELALESSREMAALGPDYRLYLLGEPRVFVGFPTFEFSLPGMDKYDLKLVSAGTVATLPRDKGAFFVAIPEHRADLERLRQLAPGGTWSEFPRVTRPEVLFYAYTLPAQP